MFALFLLALSICCGLLALIYYGAGQVIPAFLLLSPASIFLVGSIIVATINNKPIKE